MKGRLIGHTALAQPLPLRTVELVKTLIAPLVLLAFPLVWARLETSLSASGRLRKRILDHQALLENLPAGPARAALEMEIGHQVDDLVDYWTKRRAKASSGWTPHRPPQHVQEQDDSATSRGSFDYITRRPADPSPKRTPPASHRAPEPPRKPSDAHYGGSEIAPPTMDIPYWTEEPSPSDAWGAGIPQTGGAPRLGSRDTGSKILQAIAVTAGATGLTALAAQALAALPWWN